MCSASSTSAMASTKVTTGSLELKSSATPSGQHQLHTKFLYYFLDTLFPSCKELIPICFCCSISFLFHSSLVLGCFHSTISCPLGSMWINAWFSSLLLHLPGISTFPTCAQSSVLVTTLINRQQVPSWERILHFESWKWNWSWVLWVVRGRLFAAVVQAAVWCFSAAGLQFKGVI